MYEEKIKTLYIWQQIKKQEQKKIEKQYKAMRKLYKILDETNDIKTMEKLLEEWKKKYPIDAFLNMYQKKIKRLTSEKNIKENAFDQDKAFYDLYRITKINGTFDELKEELKKWKEKYRIDTKFKIDDFIKNQSNVKRYTSDEYLNSIAKHEQESEDLSNQNNQEEITEEAKEHEETEQVDMSQEDLDLDIDDDTSDLGKQARAYSALMIIMKESNNLDKVFNWIHKNGSIKFNEEYKQLILSATYLQYSPTFLRYLDAPELDVLKSSLTIDEFQRLNEIKRYAVISYFNLLLPKDQAIPNDHFYRYIREIYFKTKNSKILDEISVFDSKEEEPISELQIDQRLDSTEIENEIPVEQDTDSIEFNADLKIETENSIDKIADVNLKQEEGSIEIDLEIPVKEENHPLEIVQQEPVTQEETFYSVVEEKPVIQDNTFTETIEEEPVIQEKEIVETVEEEPLIQERTFTKATVENTKQQEEKHPLEIVQETTIVPQEIMVEPIKEVSKEPEEIEEPELKDETPVEPVQENVEKEENHVNNITPLTYSEKEIEPDNIEPQIITSDEIKKEETQIENVEIKEDTIETSIEAPVITDTDEQEFDEASYSQLFFDTIYDYSVQADLINEIDNSAQEYVEREYVVKSNENEIEKNKLDN